MSDGIKWGVTIPVILGVVIGLTLVSYGTINLSNSLTRDSLREATKLNEEVIANSQRVIGNQQTILKFQEKVIAGNEKLLANLEADLKLSNTNYREVMKIQKMIGEIKSTDIPAIKKLLAEIKGMKD